MRKMRAMLYKHSGLAIFSFGFGFQMEENWNQVHSYLALKMLLLVFWDLAAPPFVFIYSYIICIPRNQYKKGCWKFTATHLKLVFVKTNHELLIAKFRLKLKKVGKTTRPCRYDLNQIPYDYTVEVRNRFKGLDLIDRVPDEL